MVARKGKVEIGNSGWIHAGGYTTNHGGNVYNHWMTASASAGLIDAAQNFLATYPEQGMIAVNDMSLPYGGTFDIEQDWEVPHRTHSTGAAVDVRARTAVGSYSIPAAQIDDFLEECDDAGAIESELEHEGTFNQHIHCRWP